MMTRLSSLCVVLFWAVSMAWVIRHDVVPAWTAQDPPKFAAGAWLTDQLLKSQARIEDKYGHRLGTVWTEHQRTPAGLFREDVVWVDRFPGMPRLRIEAQSTFTREGDLDEFRLEVFGAGQRVELVGERFSGDLAFRLWVGTDDQLFSIDAPAAGLIGDVFRPFPNLPRIVVGQSWRMHVVNPLAAISGIGTRLIPMVVTVTGKEPIDIGEGSVECFVVQTERARAWVDQDGIVLRQEMDLPYGGTLDIVAETYDDQSRASARAVPLDSGMP